MHHRYFASLISASLMVIDNTSAAVKLNYPTTFRGQVVDIYHGVAIPDPYRALEDANAATTHEFVRAQNALSQPLLETLTQRPWIHQKLTKLSNYERFGLPVKHGAYYFFLNNSGTQNHSVLYVSEKLAVQPRVLFDPNKASSDQTVALSRFSPSPDGNTLAYALSHGGTDWDIWKFKRVVDGGELKDELRFTKFWEVAWARDGSGVYYSRYAVRSDDVQHGDDSAQPAVYFHTLGQPQSQDRLVYQVLDHATRIPEAGVSEDGQYLFISLFDGYQANGLELLDLRKAHAKRQVIFGAWDAQYKIIGSDGEMLYVKTTQNASRGRVIAVDVRRPEPENWREIIPEQKMALQDTQYIGGRFIAHYMSDARSIAKVFDIDGKFFGDVPVNSIGSISGFSGEVTGQEVFFSYTDYLSPGKIIRLDLANNTVRVVHESKISADTSPYVTHQVFYSSKDGTRVPMFLTQRRDLIKNGKNPTLLYGYGGFNVSAMAAFKPSILVWLEMGGVFAEANLRGGGEYGEAWHEAGTKIRKQNVFDDFIAAAEYLIRQGYTNPRKLAISGRSNGGLLVGASLLQRPELFAAALPAVGVMDMLRYHTASSNARQWSSDFGLSEDPDEFLALRAYSPVHNTKPGACYPATLVTAAKGDDRVVPWHSYKFAAGLQHAQGCDFPILLRVETRTGHGAGKPLWMQIDDFADQWAFLAQILEISVPATEP